MYKDMEWLTFGTVRQFSALWDFFEKNQKLLAAPPARIIITPADNEYACAYLYDLMLCKKIVLMF